MKYSVDKLLKEIENGNQIEYLFFWGHTQKKENIIDKSCFSQWFVSPFEVDSIVYPTAEHWMMAKKALLFNDKDNFDRIINNSRPDEVKKLGRKVKNFDAIEWSSKSYQFVVEGNFYKFSQHKSLATFLLATENKVIVEASPYDTIWGIGLKQDVKEAQHPKEWNGTNLLGFALMEVRDRLKESNL